jgi:acyl-CoA synthetase (AMP-forming)/AMP-acid ligase II
MPDPQPLYDITTFWQLVERRAELSPDRPMLLDDKGRRVTFSEFEGWAERVAAGLQAWGVTEGTAVTWQLPTRIETVVTSLALSRLGAVQNPIIPIYRDREVGFLLRETAAELFLVPGHWRGFDYLEMANRLAKGMPDPPRIHVVYDSVPEGDPSTLPPFPPGDPDDPPVRWIYSTSGTTADPKGVRHTDGTLIAGGIGLSVALDLSPDDIGSITFPYTHIGGPDYLVNMLTVGFASVVLETFVPDQAVEVLRDLGVTVSGGSTAFYTAFIHEQRQQPDKPIIPTLRLLSGGGAPKPPEVFFEARRELHVPVLHGMGMTEVPMIVMGAAGDTDEQLAYTDGKPVRGAEVRIVGEDGSLLPAGAVGELRVKGPMVFKGYTRPELTAQAFDEDGFFRTGDLAMMRDDGHIVLTGRIKDIIIRKGENIGAKEIEDLLYEHPRVADVAVIGLPDPTRGERVCAVIETAPGQEPLTFAEMLAYCKEAGLMTQKIPEQLELVDQLPRNATMKILKYQLREQLASKPWPSP